jgi:SAM-dependent methyltransferase
MTATATRTVQPWYGRRRLRPVLCDALGITEQRRQRLWEEDRVAWQRWWSEATVAEQAAYLPEYQSGWYGVVALECFSDHSAGATRRFAGWFNDAGLDGRVLDVGAGIGATTRLFAELTGATTIGHAYGQGAQLEVMRRLLDDAPGTSIVVNPDEVAAVADVRPYAVLAYELVEHLREPLTFIRALTDLDVRVLSCANSFVDDFGHWSSYLCDGDEVPRDRMAKRFGAEMRALGWSPVKTGFWNNRPQVWTR